MVSKNDGRYRRSLVTLGLEVPTAIAVDPEYGRVFWADAGSQPKIEVSWMDGNRRKPLVLDKLGRPSAIAIDYAMGHTVFWADSKLNTIESIRQDGTNRKLVLRGEKLRLVLGEVDESTKFTCSL